VDCVCTIQKQKLVRRVKGIRFEDVFMGVDNLLDGRVLCASYKGYYLVRVDGRLAFPSSSYIRKLIHFR
jgi:hypothetical protein